MATSQRAALAVVLALVVGAGCTDSDKTRLTADRTTTTLATTTTTTSPAPAPDGASPLENNSEAAGPGGMGARRTTRAEGVGVTLELDRRDGGPGDAVRASVLVEGAAVVTRVVIDYGDRTQGSAPTPEGACGAGATTQAFAPDPPAKQYRRAGDYDVEARVTLLVCASGDVTTMATKLTYHQH